jgi:hypothetical protein
MAARIWTEGRVTVSERKSIKSGILAFPGLPCFFVASCWTAFQKKSLKPNMSLEYPVSVNIRLGYGICAMGSSITGVRFPSFTATAHSP